MPAKRKKTSCSKNRTNQTKKLKPEASAASSSAVSRPIAAVSSSSPPPNLMTAAAQASIPPLLPAKPSTRERPPPQKESMADGRPEGSEGLRRVLKTQQFLSLLRGGLPHEWKEAIRLIQNSTEGEIDCNWFPGSKPFRYWMAGGRDWTPIDWDSNPNEIGEPVPEAKKLQLETKAQHSRIIYDTYQAINLAISSLPEGSAARLLGESNFTEKSLTTLSDALFVAISTKANVGHLLVIFAEMSLYKEYPDDGCIELAIRDPIFSIPTSLPDLDPDGIACIMIRMIPKDGRDDAYRLLNSKPWLLSLACVNQKENVVRALLEHLPVLEIDGDILPKSTIVSLLPEIRRLLRTGRECMVVYRRRRALLLREVLADRLQHDLFDLIDAYGEASLSEAYTGSWILYTSKAHRPARFEDIDLHTIGYSDISDEEDEEDEEEDSSFPRPPASPPFSPVLLGAPLLRSPQQSQPSPPIICVEDEDEDLEEEVELEMGLSPLEAPRPTEDDTESESDSSNPRKTSE